MSSTSFAFKAYTMTPDQKKYNSWARIFQIIINIFSGTLHPPKICTLFVFRCGQVATDLPISHYSDVIMSTISSQITSLTIVYSTVYSGENQRKHQSSASLAFVRSIHRRPVNSPHKWPVTRKMIPFDDVIMFPGYPTGTRIIIYNATLQVKQPWRIWAKSYKTLRRRRINKTKRNKTVCTYEMYCTHPI